MVFLLLVRERFFKYPCQGSRPIAYNKKSDGKPNGSFRIPPQGLDCAT